MKSTLAQWLRPRPRHKSRPASRASIGAARRYRRPLLDALEERQLLSVSTLADEPAALAAAQTSQASDVVGRFTFYNNSKFDRFEAAIGLNDNAAIASDKQALLPGQIARFTNYTSFASGINGVMIDMAGLADTPTLDDFVFRVGNSSDPAHWVAAPAPLAVQVNEGGGVNGSTRITFTWPDGVVKNTWLQVTVRATANTGLASPDVFYFGNAVGESGNSPNSAMVTAVDQAATRGWNTTPANPAPITSPYDYDRDGYIGMADEIIAANAYNGQGGMLSLITASAGPGDSSDLVPPNESHTSSTSSDVTPAYVDLVLTDVVQRSIFYNHSLYDGINPAANAQDDLAIATDKVALRPGETATSANYTNYSRGINGIIVDVAGLVGEPSVDDFVFRVGQSNHPGTWELAPAPLSISVRRGAGVGGSDRVTIIWPDNAIENQWLEVTMKASLQTGLKQDDVFYFGNLIGDAPSAGPGAMVTVADQYATRNSPYSSLANPAPITEGADFNRDRVVNEADEWIARSRFMAVTQFRTISPVAAAVEPAVDRPHASFSQSGDGGYVVTFNPKLAKTNNGTLIWIAQGHADPNDDTRYAVVMKRSFDNGITWTPIKTLYAVPKGTATTIGPTALVIDEVTGTVVLLFMRNASNVMVMTSQNDGTTWSTARDITSSVKVMAGSNPNPAVYPNSPWGWYVLLDAIQLKNGPYAGRLLAGGDHRLSADRDGPSWSHVIYSDDHGQTWHLGGGPPQTALNANSNEIALIEAPDGSVYMSIRHEGMELRGEAWSYDGGLTWTDMQMQPQLTKVRVHGSLVRINETTVAFAAPDDVEARNNRRSMTLWVSYDNMQTWVKSQPLSYDFASYSAMVAIDHDTILLAFNGDRAPRNARHHMFLVRVNLRALQTELVPQFTWHFNERAPGEAAELGGYFIQETSQWDHRMSPQANVISDAPQYVEGPNGHTALRLTEGSDRIEAGAPANKAIQALANESFTAEFVLRTTDDAGFLIGTRVGVPGWMLNVVDGYLEFRVADTSRTSMVVSPAPINDGAWHKIVVIRDTVTRQIVLRIDGVEVASAADTTTKSLYSSDSQGTYLGADVKNLNHLAFDIDVMRFTRKVLTPAEELPMDFAEPPRVPPATFGDDAPNSIAGLEFWLPKAAPEYAFGDMFFSDFLPEKPLAGAAVMSAYDQSPNRYRVTGRSDQRFVLYSEDTQVGGSYQHSPDKYNAGRPWVVQASNGTMSANNFDFVQNTGVFTLSAFVKRDLVGIGDATLIDTNNDTMALNGFNLSITNTGAVQLKVSGSNGLVRYNDSTPNNTIMSGVWYHIAVVGSGPGQPVRFYVTPVNASGLALYTRSAFLGADGNYPTAADQDLSFAARAKSAYEPLDGRMVDQAIFNRALTPAEIQQLFLYTKQAN